MKKRIKAILAAAAAVLLMPVQAFAAAADAQASFAPHENEAEVSVVLGRADTGAGVTALQMTFHLTAQVGSLEQAQLHFEFDKSLPGNIHEYRLDEAGQTLTVYVAGAQEGLFEGDTARLGTLSLSGDKGQRIRVEVLTGTTAPDADVSEDLKLLTGGTTLRAVSMEESSVVLDTESPSPQTPSRPHDRDDDDDDDDRTPSRRPSRPKAPQTAEDTKPQEPSAPAPVPTAPVVSGGTAGAQQPAAPDPQQAQPDSEGAYGEQELKELFERESETVQLDVSERTRVHGSVFSLLRQRPDGQLILSGEGYRWLFDSKEVPQPEAVGTWFDSAVSFDLSEQAEQAIRASVQDAPYLAFETAHSGALPGKAVLQLELGEAYAGKSLYLYHQPMPGQPEQLAMVQADEGGSVELPLEHCSVFFLTERELALTTDGDSPAEQEAASQPTQADKAPLPMVLIAVAVILAACVILGIILYRKKQA